MLPRKWEYAHGELAKDWETHQLFIYDENNNTTNIFLFPIGRDTDVGPGKFLVHGFPSPQSYSDGDAVLLTSCWNGTKSTLVWDIEHYDIAKDLIIFQGVGLLAGIILTIVGRLLFTSKKNRTETQ